MTKVTIEITYEDELIQSQLTTVGDAPDSIALGLIAHGAVDAIGSMLKEEAPDATDPQVRIAAANALIDVLPSIFEEDS